MTLGEMKQLMGGLFADKSKIYLEFCYSSEMPSVSSACFELAPNSTIYGIEGVHWGIGNYGMILFPNWVKLKKN